MIVTFQTTINPSSDNTACFMNFLRCVTAIATAPAGTTSLTVNPYVASNNIDTTRNCIISIDCNTEAGGWTTSTTHNVVSSLSNTATTYTSIASAGAYFYKADFFNNSGKPDFPFKKLSFHSYGPVPSTSNNAYMGGASISTSFTQAQVTANAGANMLITFGCSTTTNWSSSFAPGGGVNGGSDNVNNGAQTTSYTLNAWGGTAVSQIPGLVYVDPGIQYCMAVTADYCIIWEKRVGDSYNTGFFTVATSGNGTTNWNGSRFGSIYYMGLRENQPWETPLPNNPPWVCWQHTQNDRQGGGGGTGQAYSWNQVAAFMLTYNNSNVASTTPLVYGTVNNWRQDYFFQSNTTTVGPRGLTPGSYNHQGSQQLDGPIFHTRNMHSNSTYYNTTINPTNSTYSRQFQLGQSENMLYMPQYDPVTGVFVPGAWPIKISRSYTGDWNPGGACRGIYKSLSMPFVQMKQYWQSATQTFNINGEQYMPIVLQDDMFLVRFA